jgi:hypothetical protein
MTVAAEFFTHGDVRARQQGALGIPPFTKKRAASPRSCGL